LKCVIPDAGDAAGDGDARQAAAAIECVIPDAGDAVTDGDAREASTASKCVIPDAGDVVGNDDARQAAAVIECVIPDAGDTAPVNSSWNLNRASGACRIVGNRHRYVVGIDLVGISIRRRHAIIGSHISGRSIRIIYNCSS